ncbi:PP2C family serine/threonine-protein phosphatase [Geitlerinema sp. PCC 7407]|uniref:PP2C family protein-serine/threonine phosphatase n=1 Tax=Geitlerinema sp. PCC 7407 TaxID=1173025 RepID=UPI00029FE860|nr:protein phosphatase 2C domain-containing protein [Geitlerinema sp. PCC 7407]AFY67887.1 protein serine/threonine phosphatase [Geitlerinema sp. PCC 7407]
MQDAAAPLYCPNPLCQSPNGENQRFCKKCRAPLTRRYLWVVGANLSSDRAGELLGGRYWLKRAGVLLDTQPAFLPQMPETITAAMTPYLKLSPYKLHLPQLYGVLPLEGPEGAEALLLENAPFYDEAIAAERGAGTPDDLLPTLDEAWGRSTALRQLNWLWQMAQLWQPLSLEGVAGSLVEPYLLRVEGPLVRLLELQLAEAPVTLAQLGQFWQRWLSDAQPAVKPFLERLCQQLIHGEIRNAEMLVALLDEGLTNCGRSQPRQIQIATRSDQGPTRQRNEDACYPPAGTVLTVEPGTQSLTIVCDGIGGHEGGDVASNLAIATVRDRVQQIDLTATSDPQEIIHTLEMAVYAANDALSDRNDSEHRQERQRMGTTLVMTLAQAHTLYVTHVGDSRAYWITRQGCHQLTVDDDVAAREVRMGYTPHRAALQQAGSGSLVQALGMASSSSLYPTVQRLVLDEDGVLLLCSDGLSDYDRVEHCWTSEILPILEGAQDLSKVTERLIELANTLNGHDNVTVALIHYQVQSEGKGRTTAIPVPVAQSPPAPATAGTGRSPTTEVKTQLIAPPARSPLGLWKLLLLLLLLGLGSVLAWLFWPLLRSSLGPTATPPVDPTQTPSPSVTPASPPTAITSFRPSLLFRVDKTIAPGAGTPPPTLELQSQPGAIAAPTTAAPDAAPLSVPDGSLLRVLRRQEIQGQGLWLQLELCPAPAPIASPAPAASPPPRRTGWIAERAIAPYARSVTEDTPSDCAPPGPQSGESTPEPSVQNGASELPQDSVD